jgi:hypothetical protein
MQPLPASGRLSNSCHIPTQACWDGEAETPDIVICLQLALAQDPLSPACVSQHNFPSKLPLPILVHPAFILNISSTQ